MLQAGNVGGGGAFLGFQFRGIQHGNQLALLNMRAFVHQKLLQASGHLRAHDDLVGIYRADQHRSLPPGVVKK